MGFSPFLFLTQTPLCPKHVLLMASFAFLPRPLRARETRPKLKRTKADPQSEHKYPKGIVLRASFTRPDMASSLITSLLEHLLPRSCHYVHAGAPLNGKVSRVLTLHIRDRCSHLSLPVSDLHSSCEFKQGSTSQRCSRQGRRLF